MMPEDKSIDVEWFDSDLWSPPLGRVVLVLTIDGYSEFALYNGEDFLSINENEPISIVGYWSYDE